MDNFAEWLKKELEKRNWKQADLARATNMDSAVISNLINQRRKPGEDSCRAIARAFGYPPETVFRAAGILPPLNPEIEELEKFKHILQELTPAEREELYRIGWLKLDLRRQGELRRKMGGEKDK